MLHLLRISEYLIAKDDAAGLFKDIARHRTIVIVKVYHVLVVIATKNRGDSYKSADVDIGVGPVAYLFGNVFPSTALPEILILDSGLATFHDNYIINNLNIDIVRNSNMMQNITGYYRFMLQRSLPLKITLILVLLSFPLSIVFTITCLALDCSYSVFYRSCSYLAPENPF